MGITYQARLYYGISFLNAEYPLRTLFRHLLTKHDEVDWIDQSLPRTEDALDAALLEDHAFDLEEIDPEWGNANDLVITRQLRDFRMPLSYICIQGTDYSTWKIKGGIEAMQITLPGIDTRLWDRMLAAWCETHEIPFTTPGFTLINRADWDGNVAIFTYGLAFEEKEAEVIEEIVGFQEGVSRDREFDVIKGKDISEIRKNCKDPIFLVYFSVDHGIEIYFLLGITNVTFTTWCESTFDLDFPMRAQWDRLLKVQFDRFDLPWQRPTFHLTVHEW
jgi:hypothetical protein